MAQGFSDAIDRPGLTDPGELWNAAIEQVSRTMKMDDVAKRVELLTCMSAYTGNPINLFLEGPTSTGKTYGIMQTSRLFPDNDVIKLGGMSKRTLQYDYTEIGPDGGRLVRLWNKILIFLEAPDKETFMHMRPLLSHDAEEIMYKTVVRMRRKKGKTSDNETDARRIEPATGTEAPETMTVKMVGWPATVFCTSTPPYMQDLRTRGISLSPERSEAKRKAANILSGNRAARPWRYTDSPELTLVRSEIAKAVEYLKTGRITVLVPYGNQLAEEYPVSLDRDMRDFKRFISMIQARAAWEILNRPVVSWVDPAKGKVRSPVATKMDCLEVAWIFNQLILATRFEVPQYIVHFYNDMFLESKVESYESYGSLRELQDSYRFKHKEILAKQTASRYIDYLEQAGWVAKEPDIVDKRKMKIVRLIKESLPTYAAKFPETFTAEELQAWSQDLEKNCGTVAIEEPYTELIGGFVPVNEGVDLKRLNLFDGDIYTPPKLTPSSTVLDQHEEPAPGEYLCPLCRTGFTKTQGWKIRAAKHVNFSHGTEGTEAIEHVIQEIREAGD